LSWTRWARRAYLIALVAAAGALFALRRDEVRALVTGTRPLPLLAALALGLVSLGQSAWFWSRALHGLGTPLGFAPVLRATVSAIPARYLPGSVWYAAGRVAQLRNLGAPTSALATVAAVETALSFAVAVAIGGALAALTGFGVDGWVGLTAAALALAAIGSPWAANAAMAFVARRRGLAEAPRLRWATYAELCAHLTVFWVASAAAFVAYLHAFPALDLPSVLRTAGQFLLAWAAGFVAVFAPQGAGVFEASMAALLVGTPSAALALVVAGYRGLTAVRDVLALVALAIARATSRSS
jgi:glycosyltransferase 2 family protein